MTTATAIQIVTAVENNLKKFNVETTPKVEKGFAIGAKLFDAASIIFPPDRFAKFQNGLLAVIEGTGGMIDAFLKPKEAPQAPVASAQVPNETAPSA